MFDTQRWRASPVWLLYNLIRAMQFNVHAVKYSVHSTAHEASKASFNKNGRGLAKVGVVTLKFSSLRARTLLKEPPLLKFLDPPL